MNVVIDQAGFGDTMENFGFDSNNDEIRARTLKKLKLSAESNKETLRLFSLRAAQRDQIKAKNASELEDFYSAKARHQRDRNLRWSTRNRKSPFAVDLVAEYQTCEEELQVKNCLDARRKALMKSHVATAHSAIFNRAVMKDTELEALRAEKRQLFLQEKRLRALHDVGKWQMRSSMVAAERKRDALQRKQNIIEGMMNNPAIRSNF